VVKEPEPSIDRLKMEAMEFKVLSWSFVVLGIVTPFGSVGTHTGGITHGSLAIGACLSVLGFVGLLANARESASIRQLESRERVSARTSPQAP
jgi:hypothetical protein